MCMLNNGELAKGQARALIDWENRKNPVAASYVPVPK